MSSTLPPQNPTAYLGIKERNPPELYFRDRSPTVDDARPYDVGDIWIDQTNNKAFILIKKIGPVATWEDMAGIPGDIDSLTGNAGGAVFSDAADNINVLGDATQGSTTSGNPGTNTITITNTDATDAQKGVSELATDAESIAGADAIRTIVPTSLKAKLGAQTDHGVPIGATDTAAIAWTAEPSDGQLLIGDTGNPPALGTITPPASGITVTNGASSITLGLNDDLGALEGLATTGMAARTGASVWATRTLTAGTGITIVDGDGIAGNPTISSTGSGVGWTDVTGTSQAMAVNQGYQANNAGLVTLTLPAAAAFGDIVQVAGFGAGGFTIAQNAGQTIHFLSTDTTTGAGGSLSSTNRYDNVELLCNVANVDFSVIRAGGNLTAV